MQSNQIMMHYMKTFNLKKNVLEGIDLHPEYGLIRNNFYHI